MQKQVYVQQKLTSHQGCHLIGEKVIGWRPVGSGRPAGDPGGGPGGGPEKRMGRRLGTNDNAIPLIIMAPNELLVISADYMRSKLCFCSNIS